MSGFARFGPVVRNYLRMGLLQRGELFIDCMSYPPVEFFTPALEQRLIGGIPDQRMLELIGGLRRNPSDLDQVRFGRAAQSTLELFFTSRKYRA